MRACACFCIVLLMGFCVCACSDALGDVVHDLREIALAQGAAAEEDMATIKRIGDKTDRSRVAIDATNARVQKLL